MNPEKSSLVCLLVVLMCPRAALGSFVLQSGNVMAVSELEASHRPAIGLLHGRIYDSTLGRFLSPDAVVQFPDDLQSYNRYSYVRNNPLTKVDPKGWYEEAGHFYTTFMVARASGLNADRAFRLAYYSQYPDERKATTAYSSVTDSAWRLRNQQSRDEYRNVQENLHSLHGGRGDEVNRVRTGLQDIVADRTVTDETRGLVIHALGDAYAHTRRVETRDRRGNLVRTEVQAYAFPIGHGGDGHAPDVISNRPELFGEYVTALAGALSRLTGQEVSQVQLDRIRAVVAGLPPGGDSGTADTAAFRQLAQDEFGYDDPYAPEGSDRATSERQPDLTDEQVRRATDEINDRTRNQNQR